MLKHVFFDFDGTLIDTSDGILSTVRECIHRAGIPIQIEPSYKLIGPPLRSMIATVIGSDHPGIANLEDAFRTAYDERGYLQSSPFPGIEEALQTFRASEVVLHIVTNKRLVPVRLILDSLGWSGYFETVYTLDTTPGAQTKSDVVARLLAKLETSQNSAVMVGDSLDDQLAAKANNMKFAWASWGYGQDAGLSVCDYILTASDNFASHILNGRT